jgi:hypothetical protein
MITDHTSLNFKKNLDDLMADGEISGGFFISRPLG